MNKYPRWTWKRRHIYVKFELYKMVHSQLMWVWAVAVSAIFMSHAVNQKLASLFLFDCAVSLIWLNISVRMGEFIEKINQFELKLQHQYRVLPHVARAIAYRILRKHRFTFENLELKFTTENKMRLIKVKPKDEF